MSINLITETETSYALVECKEYFPLYLWFDKSIKNIEHIGFYHENTDLLEFSVDSNTKIVRKMVLTLSKHYRIMQSETVFPSDCLSGTISLLMDQRMNCTVFFTTVYQNGIVITLSENIINKSYRMDKIIVSADENDNIVKIFVADLTPNEISHTIRELNFGS